MGASVAILTDDGDMIAIGAPQFGNGTNQGAVRVYQKADDGFFSKIGSDILGADEESFGSSLSGANGRVVVGSALDGFRSYDFNSTSGDWEQVGTAPTTNSTGVTAISTNGDATSVVVGLATDSVSVYSLS